MSGGKARKRGTDRVAVVDEDDPAHMATSSRHAARVCSAVVQQHVGIVGGVLCYLREQRCCTTTHPRRITPIYQHLHDTDFLSIVLDGGVVHVNAIGLSRDELLLVAEGISEGDRPEHVEVGSPAGFEWLED